MACTNILHTNPDRFFPEGDPWGRCIPCDMDRPDLVLLDPVSSDEGRDIFYVVANADTVKFGMSQLRSFSRLDQHQSSRGFNVVHRLFTRLPSGTALALEDLVKEDLGVTSHKPRAGHTEYFDLAALPDVLAAVDRHAASYRDRTADFIRAYRNYRLVWRSPEGAVTRRWCAMRGYLD